MFSRRLITCCFPAVAAGLLLCAPGAAVAQESRAAQISEAQAEKATRLHPYVPTRAEAAIARAEQALMGPPTGFYPWMGSIFPGGLFSIGPGVRVPFANRVVLDAQAAVSLKVYKLGRATLTLPPLADRRVRVAFQVQTIDAPTVPFYGVGNDSRSEDRSAFLFRPTSVSAAIAVKPAAQVELGGRVESLAIHTGRVKSGAAVEDRFTPAEAPGVLASPTYLVTAAHAAFDWRDSPGYSRRGGYYRLGWSDYNERASGSHSFRRIDADLRQMIPLLRENWVIALRASASTTSADPGQQVPFFLMPQLGGGSDLRGYSSWRFRDRHRVLVGAEYRWTPSHFVDMAIFHDAGKVASTRSQVNLRGLTHTNGIGIRVHAPAATFLRFEFARGAEGIGLIVAFGQSF